MTKLLGCTLILSAAALFLCRRLRERHTASAAVEELACTMDRIATAIRWQETPLPEALAACQTLPYTGLFFRKITEYLKREVPLQEAWTEAFSTIDPMARDVLCSLSLQGDREHLLRQFHHAAQQLQKRHTQLQDARRSANKLTCGAVLSGAAMLMILLL